MGADTPPIVAVTDVRTYGEEIDAVAVTLSPTMLPAAGWGEKIDGIASARIADADSPIPTARPKPTRHALRRMPR
jgi:hypothetical protein